MFENPEITRKLVDGRIDRRCQEAAARRLASAARSRPRSRRARPERGTRDHLFGWLRVSVLRRARRATAETSSTPATAAS